MANGIPGIDPTIIERGTAAARPSLFQQSLPGLFAQQQQLLERGQDVRTNLLKKILPGLFKPSKREQQLLDVQKRASAAELGRAREGIRAEARGAGIEGAGFGASGVFEAAARGNRSGFEALKQQGPVATGIRELAATRATTAEARAVTQENRAIAEEKRKSFDFGRRSAPTSLESMQRVIAEETAEARILGKPTPGPGQGVVVSPITNQPQIVNLEGTEKFAAKRAELLGAQNAIRLSSELASLTDAAGITGTDFFGENSVKMGAKRSQLMSAIFESRGLGAPQGPDIELVEAGLPDPTSFASNARAVAINSLPLLNIPLSASMKSEFITGFNEAGAEAEQTMTDILMEQPQLIDLVDQTLLDPAGELAQVIEKLRTGL
jgi:hypothetical protein